MKLKRIVLVGMMMVLIGVGALNAQVSFIDQFAFGGAYGLNEEKKDSDSGGIFDHIHFIMDYWLGAYVQDIDSAIYLGIRTDMESLDVGGVFDYHFTNSAGFSLGAGAEVFGMDTYDDDHNKIPHEISPYVRVGAFLHLMTMMKLGADFTYKFNGQQRVGVYVTFNSASLFNRLTGYQPIRRTSNRDIIGRWILGDTENGAEWIFNEDFTMKAITYDDGRARTQLEGTWATTDEGGLMGVQMIFLNQRGLSVPTGYRVDLENDELTIIYDGVEDIFHRYVE